MAKAERETVCENVAPQRKRVEVVRVQRDGFEILAVGSVSAEDAVKYNLVSSGDGVIRITDILLDNATRELRAIIPDLNPP